MPAHVLIAVLNVKQLAEEIVAQIWIVKKEEDSVHGLLRGVGDDVGNL